MSAKSKYFAKLRSEVVRVRSDEASSQKSYIVTLASETCEGMPQEGGAKVVSMSSTGTVRAVFRGSEVVGGAGSGLGKGR